MMDRFTRAELKRLVEAEANPAVSIYMPTYRAGRDVRQNAIRFRNLMKQAERRLADERRGDGSRAKLLDEARGLEGDDDWWQHQSDGLAMFLEAGRLERYRIPLVVAESVTIGSRFYLRPMVKMLQNDGRFYLIAVSQNRVRLMSGTRHGISELDQVGLPTDLRSALNIDEYVSSLQQHSAGGPAEAGNMLFHGHGGAGMEVHKKDEILQFFHRINAPLCRFLADEQTPLVFAGVDYLFPLFRQACDYASLVESPAKGNPDDRGLEELHVAAWSIVEPRFDAARERALEQYQHLCGSGKTADELSDVVRAARQATVETLLLAEGERRYGIVDEQLGSIATTSKEEERAEELLNYAAIHTLASGGNVYTLTRERLPRGQTAVALLRFAVT